MKTGCLLALARHLERIEATPPEKRSRAFDIEYVFRKGVMPRTRANRCGTAACAMGETPFVPVLAKAGMRYNRRGVLVNARFPDTMGYDYLAMRLFDIDMTTADDLFSPVGYVMDPTPGDVAAKIRAVVARYKAESKKAAA